MKTTEAETDLSTMLLRRLTSTGDASGPAQRADALRGKLPASLHPMLDALTGLIEGKVDDAASGPAATVARLAHDAGGDVPATLLRFMQVNRSFAPVKYAAAKELDGRMLYSIVMFALILTIFLVMAFSFVPSIVSIFDAFVARLPVVTELFFVTAGGALGWVVVTMVAAYTFMFAWFARDMRRALFEMRPCPHRWYRIPVLRKLARRHSLLLLAVYADALRAGGVDSARALEAATRASGAELPAADDFEADEWSPLALARDIDALDEELDYQGNEAVDLFATDFNMVMQNVTGIYHTLFGITVGLLVIAIYLPIFAMGGTISS